MIESFHYRERGGERPRGRHERNPTWNHAGSTCLFGSQTAQRNAL